MPKAQMDDLVARTGGDVAKLEQALGIPEGMALLLICGIVGSINEAIYGTLWKI